MTAAGDEEERSDDRAEDSRSSMLRERRANDGPTRDLIEAVGFGNGERGSRPGQANDSTGHAIACATTLLIMAPLAAVL
jgi:hypothetical protein